MKNDPCWSRARSIHLPHLPWNTRRFSPQNSEKKIKKIKNRFSLIIFHNHLTGAEVVLIMIVTGCQYSVKRSVQNVLGAHHLMNTVTTADTKVIIKFLINCVLQSFINGYRHSCRQIVLLVEVVAFWQT